MNLKEKTVVIDNKTYRYSKIVMLESKNKAEYDELFLSNGRVERCIARGTVTCRLNAQHLYFLSTDKICEGDWAYNEDLNIVSNNFDGDPNLSCDKIIASTDSLLNLPKPSEQFLQVYIDCFNRKEVIEDCLVEYEDLYKCNNGTFTKFGKNRNDVIPVTIPKVTKNEITIRKVKDSWNREEVRELLEQFRFFRNSNPDISIYEVNEWFEQNL